MNRAQRQQQKLQRFEAWLSAQIAAEKQAPAAETNEGKKIIRALERDRRAIRSQLEDAGEEAAIRGRRAQRLGFGS